MDSIIEIINKAAEKASREPWESYALDYTQTIPDAPALANIMGAPVVFRQGITNICGTAKSGKTTLLRIFAAAHLARRAVLGVEVVPGLRILWADTEQPDYRIARQVCGAFALAGIPVELSDTLTVLNLRTMATAERWTAIRQAATTLNPDIIIIDGAADLVEDVNDLAASDKMVSELLTLSTEADTALITVVHTNQGQDGGKTRGHIGSAIERRCEANLSMTRDPETGIFTVHGKELRDKPFADLRFAIDDHGTPYLTTEPEKPQKPRNATDWLLYEMKPGITYRHTDLIQLITQHGGTESNAKTVITTAARKGWISKSGDGYSLPLAEVVSQVEDSMFDGGG